MIWRLRHALPVLLVPPWFVWAACDNTETETDEPPGMEQRLEVLENFQTNVAAATYAEFVAATADLVNATEAYAADRSEPNRKTAQAAWNDAIAIWQRAEVYLVGPAGLSDQVIGGEDLRDEIYAWPFVKACRIDQETVEKTYESDTFDNEPFNVRGLGAMEYLLFTETTENDCAPNSSINSDGAWGALDDSEITQRRAEYALRAAESVKARAEELESAWQDFGPRLAAGDDPYSNSQDALNAVSDALFYIEKEVKDTKLGPPAGLFDCAADSCPESVESPWAARSLEHIEANLLAFQEAFTGGSGAGFDDLLSDAGNGTDAAINDATDDTLAALADVDGPLSLAVDEDSENVQSAFEELRALITLLKNDFIDDLELRLPKRAEGDND